MGFSGIIQKLISDGDLIMYHDYRSGSAHDWSGNSNDGAYTDTTWVKKGIRFDAGTANVLVGDDSSFSTTAISLFFLFDEIVDVTVLDTIFSQREGAGTDFEIYFNGTGVTFYSGASSDIYNSISAVGSKAISLSKESGSNMEVYYDGLYQGLGGSASAFTSGNCDVYIGNYYSDDRNIKSQLQTVFVVNRSLTADEHAELYTQLNSMTRPS